MKRFRQVWPQVKIVFRGDSGFCRWRMFRWCESNDVEYIMGIGKNSVLLKNIKDDMEQAKQEAELTGEAVRYFTSFQYAAKSWDAPRKIIAKIEHTEKGSNPRFVVTNRQGDPQLLYDDVYCARGDMENRIKEQQLDLFSDRTSCHDWWPNQLRLLLSGLAYVLMESLRRLALNGTVLAKAQVNTIRLKLLKIGAVILSNTRRIRFLLPDHYPWKKLFAQVAARLTPE